VLCGACAHQPKVRSAARADGVSSARWYTPRHGPPGDGSAAAFIAPRIDARPSSVVEPVVGDKGKLLIEVVGPLIPFFALSATLFGPVAGWFAGRRDRHPVVWLVFGALLGPIALLVLAIAPPGRCPSCDFPVEGWPSRCPNCEWPFSARTRGQVGRRPLRAKAFGIDEGTGRRGEPSSPIPLPIGRAPRARSERRGETSVGVLAGGTVARPAELHSLEATDVLATGVYFGGTARLIVGSRYAIARHSTQLRLLGPVDRDPAIVALERPLSAVTATAIGDRLIISEARGDRLAIALGALAGANGPQLELELSLPAERASGRPASG